MTEAPEILNKISNPRWVYAENFSGEVIAAQMEDLEKRLLHHEFDRNTVKKIVRIFIELAQNIQMHGADEHNMAHEYSAQIVFEVIGRQVKITASNLATDSCVKQIQNRINKINNASPDKLNEMYVETLRVMREPAPRGAGLGLIEIARKTRSNIELKVSPAAAHLSQITLSIICK